MGADRPRMGAAFGSRAGGPADSKCFSAGVHAPLGVCTPAAPAAFCRGSIWFWLLGGVGAVWRAPGFHSRTDFGPGVEAGKPAAVPPSPAQEGPGRGGPRGRMAPKPPPTPHRGGSFSAPLRPWA